MIFSDIGVFLSNLFMLFFNSCYVLCRIRSDISIERMGLVGV